MRRRAIALMCHTNLSTHFWRRVQIFTFSRGYTSSMSRLMTRSTFGVLYSPSSFGSNLRSENRATGVAFTLNPLLYPDGANETRTVRGTKLVVLSAGSFGTPGILERSGIGSKDVLQRVGVKQRVDLPGVGENYQGPLRDYLRSRPRSDLVY